MKLILIDKKTEANNIKSFYWKAQSGMHFEPGQYLYYTFDKLLFDDDRGPTRHFTIASSPTEEYILLTTRIRQGSGFKKTLDKIKVGYEIEIDGPNGEFIFDKSDANPQVLFAGGIGITPFRSFIKYNIDKNLKVPMLLVYSNSDDNFVFAKELKSWLEQYSYFDVYFHNSAKLGHIDSKLINEILLKYNIDRLKSTAWVVGPPQFVISMENSLHDKNFREVRTEKFTGY